MRTKCRIDRMIHLTYMYMKEDERKIERGREKEVRKKKGERDKEAWVLEGGKEERHGD